MDTVTEARMAIALAREGGIGIIHRNLSPEAQAREVEVVKRSESGMISDPITLQPTATLQDASDIMARFHISGIPIVEKDSQKLVGILTNRDIRFCEAQDFSRPVSDFMTREGLITAPLGTTLEQAKTILQKYRIEKLPLVDEAGHIQGLITVKDIQKKLDYPNRAVDAGGRLLCGAAIGVGSDMLERAAALVAAGVDVLSFDTAHGHSEMVLRAVEKVRSLYPDLTIFAGNVVTAAGTNDLISAGADAVKVGVGAGSICTTRVVAGVGMPQLTAVLQCARAAEERGAGIIADGGIRYSGDIVKALAAGARAVMLGNLFAGLEESPGELVISDGRRFKEYRGMGSIGAMKASSSDRYFQDHIESESKLVPEGIEGRVPYKGPLPNLVYQLIGGLRSGMGLVGAPDIPHLQKHTRIVQVTVSGLRESHVHDVAITREAPNYQR